MFYSYVIELCYITMFYNIYGKPNDMLLLFYFTNLAMNDAFLIHGQYLQFDILYEKVKQLNDILNHLIHK